IVRPITELNTTANESRGQISPDGLTLLFSTDRPGGLAPNQRDIWISTRASLANPFGAPTLVSILSSTVFDSPDWYDPNGEFWMTRQTSLVVNQTGVFKSVPEPATIAVVGMGAVAFMGGMIRRRRTLQALEAVSGNDN
ncbi:MAG TPA: PEP-CTERM sorting domain-containing protein, partial [Planctomycetota bacterium]|nr:PEP-CTERM sorting domain-containing protein [Planctomycetota bacterium]